jgi:hypothetical protein
LPPAEAHAKLWIAVREMQMETQSLRDRKNFPLLHPPQPLPAEFRLAERFSYLAKRMSGLAKKLFPLAKRFLPSAKAISA